jgi:hypothetical protein
MGLTVLYRLTGRDYRNSSGFARAFTDGTGEQRDDLRNRLTFELDVTSVALRGMRGLGLSGGALDYMTDHWQLTTAGSFTFVDSDVALYDYNREVIGAYVTYRF